MDRLGRTDPETLDAVMPDEHLTPDLLGLLLAGELPVESFLGPLLGHLQETCPECSQAVDELNEQMAAAGDGAPGRFSPPYGPASYHAAFEAALASLQTVRVASAAGSEFAGRLQALPPVEGYALLLAEPGVASPDLCHELLERAARRAAAEELQQAAELARLALACAQLLTARRFPKGLILDCQAECWCLLGEISTSQGDGEAAELAFLCAESLLTSGSGDPLTLARVSDGRARLLRRRGDLEGCAAELGRAVELYSAGGDPHLRGRTLLRRGLALWELGRGSEAREVLRAGIGLLDPQRDRTLAEQGRAALLASLSGCRAASLSAKPH